MGGFENLDVHPQRLVCLTEETTETLYLLGEQDRIVGVSGYTARPPEARLKPKVSAFTTAKFDKILALNPDLVLAFSDLQADIVRELTLRGLNVVVFNQRSVRDILQMMVTLARLVGVPEKGSALIESLKEQLNQVAQCGIDLPYRPRVLFEEWHDPLISGIQWVEELIELAGGKPIFPELRRCHAGKERIIDPQAVLARDPQVIIASWCGRKVNKEFIASRPGWSELSAVRHGHIYEIKSTYILQPGPAALTEGVRQLHTILSQVAGAEVKPEMQARERVDPDLKSRWSRHQVASHGEGGN